MIRPGFSVVVAAAVALLAVPAHAQEARTPSELFEAWSRLPENDRKDCTDWFVAECDRDKSFRSTLERFVLRAYEGDPFEWPASEPLAVFDPAKHAPAQVIPRTFVDETKGRWAKEKAKLMGPWHERAFEPAFEYVWGRGTVTALRAWDEPERIARSACEGFSPYTDLVEALVERTLDDGAVRDEAAAFGHAYSDRSGNAFPGVTLYDAWSSGAQIEMPDVECLGIVHDLDDDWKSWVAPVPERQQRPLYDHIGKHYSKLRKYRALRTALARCYLQGAPSLPAGYETAKTRLHGFWELNASDPAQLAQDLPDDKRWTKWLTERGREVDRDPSVLARSRARQAALDESRAWARRTFEGILREYGAFDPKPPSAPVPPDGDGGGDGDGDLGPARDARTP